MSSTFWMSWGTWSRVNLSRKLSGKTKNKEELSLPRRDQYLRNHQGPKTWPTRSYDSILGDKIFSQALTGVETNFHPTRRMSSTNTSDRQEAILKDKALLSHLVGYHLRISVLSRHWGGQSTTEKLKASTGRCCCTFWSRLLWKSNVYKNFEKILQNRLISTWSTCSSWSMWGVKGSSLAKMLQSTLAREEYSTIIWLISMPENQKN